MSANDPKRTLAAPRFCWFPFGTTRAGEVLFDNLTPSATCGPARLNAPRRPLERAPPSWRKSTACLPQSRSAIVGQMMPPRMRCQYCRQRSAAVMTNWNERHAPGSYRNWPDKRRQLFHPRQGMNLHNFDGRLRNLQMRMALERFSCRFMRLRLHERI